jgi:hypothetical protein
MTGAPRKITIDAKLAGAKSAFSKTRLNKAKPKRKGKAKPRIRALERMASE